MVIEGCAVRFNFAYAFNPELQSTDSERKPSSIIHHPSAFANDDFRIASLNIDHTEVASIRRATLRMIRRADGLYFEAEISQRTPAGRQFIRLFRTGSVAGVLPMTQSLESTWQRHELIVARAQLLHVSVVLRPGRSGTHAIVETWRG